MYYGTLTDPDGPWAVHEVAADYDRSWVPAWAKDKPILKIGEKDPPYTYADWLEWPETEAPMELIDGLLVTAMAFPTSFHEGIDSDICYRIRNYLKGKKGRVYNSNFAVRLFPDSEKKEDDFIVAPDVVVVLDTSKITMEGCQGAPDFIVEILSPSTSEQDKTTKFSNYLRAGVNEYWIVDPSDRTIQTYLYKNGDYVGKNYAAGPVPVATLPGLVIDFAEVFAYAEPPGEKS
jgi:Uma2 family endonuclease